MKKLFALGLLALLAPFARAATTTYVVDFTWTITSQGYPVCSSTVTTFCVVSQTLEDTTGGGSTVVCGPSLTAPSLLTTSSTSCTSTAYTPAQFPVGTSHTYSLTLQYVGSTAGTILNTPPATATVTNGLPPGNPTGVGGTVRAVVQ